MIGWATEIKVRAERRAGEMLAAARQNGELAKKGDNQHSSMSNGTTTTLPDIGISRDQSSRWQKLAGMTEEHFESAIAIAKEVAGEVTTAALLRQAKAPKESALASLPELRAR